ncbi:MAG: hypothetical protein ACN4G0_10835 [Polyangiales bacterium]
MTAKSKTRPLQAVISQPRTLVARLVLADLLAKRGDGPLERKRLLYQSKKR